MGNSCKKIILFAFCIILWMSGGAKGATDIPALQDCKDPKERDRIKLLIDGAQAEGKLTWVGTFIEPKHSQYILAGFKEYYGLKDLKCEYSMGQTSMIATKVEQKLSANRPPEDIVWNATWAWYRDLLNRGKILRYESPMYKEYTNSHKAGLSVQGYWVCDGYTFSPMYNVKSVSAAGIKDFQPTSWWDFANPRLSKLLSIGNISRSATYAHTAIGLKKALGEDWFKAMSKLKPAIYLKSAQGRDWVASGEYPISLFHHCKNASTLKRAGIDVKLIYPKEGVVIIPLAPIIISTVAHPNAAKLFIDYVRSERGANRIRDAGTEMFFGRPGIKSKHPEFLPPLEDIPLIPIDMDKEITEKGLKDIQQTSLKMGLTF